MLNDEFAAQILPPQYFYKKLIVNELKIYHLSFIIYHLSFIIYHLSFIIYHSSLEIA
jgi:hypothetical protein